MDNSPQIFARLMAWHAGDTPPDTQNRAAGTATIVLTDPAQLHSAATSGLISADTLVFVPDSTDDGAEIPECRIVHYEGEIAMPSTEISIDEDFYLFCQDYATSKYLSVIGPTVVGIFTEDDFRVFLADADSARSAGEFPEFLCSPAVRIANGPALRGAGGDGPGSRLFVGADNVVSTSPQGRPIGNLRDGPERIAQRWEAINREATYPCAVCLEEAVPSDNREAAIGKRPWLGRYLAALDAIRELNRRGIKITGVSGFGDRLHEELERRPELASDSSVDRPILLWNDSEAFLYDARRQKTFRFNRETADAAEAVIAAGSAERATALASHAAVAQVTDQLDACGLLVSKDERKKVMA